MRVTAPFANHDIIETQYHCVSHVPFEPSTKVRAKMNIRIIFALRAMIGVRHRIIANHSILGNQGDNVSQGIFEAKVKTRAGEAIKFSRPMRAKRGGKFHMISASQVLYKIQAQAANHGTAKNHATNVSHSILEHQ